MSSLFDRVYANELPGYGTRREPDYDDEPACSICHCDGLELTGGGLCLACAPREDESCADWEDRVRARRAGK